MKVANEHQAKAVLFYALDQEVLDLRRELDRADKEYKTATQDWEVARRNLGETVCTGTPDRLFRLEHGTYIDVHFVALNKYAIKIRTAE